MNEHSENEQFARLIVALEPWLIQVVIIGGWAHRLYRLHPSAQHVEYLALTTLDTDIAVDPRDVRIANPASFLAHKVLIHNKRTRSKFAKDVLYIHDTLEIFGARELKPRIHPKGVRKIQRAATDLFAELNDPIRDAAQMTGARKLPPEG
jgi:hypothetical protein